MFGLFYSLETISAWQAALIEWFEKNGKSYPWRCTRDPYAILVSEMMLQQTQIQTVLKRRFFENWMEEFPDVETLANAKEERVLKAWEGLGYYNRARNLQKAALVIMSRFGGVFPDNPTELADLPGVGPYTSGAVCSFAYNLPTPIVDGNVLRVLSRVFKFQDAVDTAPARKVLWAHAEALMSQINPRIYNSAIMELGQTICLKGSPSCPECPVSRWCLSQNDPAANLLPVKKTKVVISRKTETSLLLFHDESVFLTQETGSRRKGLWKLPELLPEGSDSFEELGMITYPITRYLVEMRVFSPPNSKQNLKIAKNYSGDWFDLSAALPPMGAPYLKAVQEFGSTKKINF